MRLCVILDRTADLPKEWENLPDLYFIPVYIYVNEMEYVDGENITTNELIEKMKQGANVRTAAPSPGVILELLEEKAEEYDNILVITVSPKLSGIYNAARAAVLMVENEDVNIEILNGNSLSIGTGLLGYRALQLSKTARSLNEVVKKLKRYVATQKLYFTIEDLKWLKKGGRVSAVTAFIGDFLDIKPVFAMQQDGSLIPKKKTRGKLKAIEYIAESLINDFPDPTRKLDVLVGHVNAQEDLQYLRSLLEEKFSPSMHSYYEVTFGSTLTVHAGPGAVGAAILEVNLEE